MPRDREVGEFVQAPSTQFLFGHHRALTEHCGHLDVVFWELGGHSVLGADGNLTLAGRGGDMYIRGGYNVHPGEVERALAGHVGVKQAAVVGRSVPVIGEIGVACVVPADVAAPPTLAELRAHVAGELADYKAPDELLIVDELPLTAMLKPDRIALRELITLRDRDIQRRRPRRSEPSDPVTDVERDHESARRRHG